MIRIHNIVKKAFCDACGGQLSSEDQVRPDGTLRGVHHGELIGHFGFGSKRDDIDNSLRKLDLCEACYDKVFRALNLPDSQYDTPFYLRVGWEGFYIDNDSPHNNEAGEIYHAPVWHCKFCEWTEGGRGYSIPNHLCENLKKIQEARKVCSLCNGADPIYRTSSFYSENQDAWIHIPKPDVEHPDEDPPCTANSVLLEFMRKGERVPPELLAQMKAQKEYLETCRGERNKKGSNEPR